MCVPKSTEVTKKPDIVSGKLKYVENWPGGGVHGGMLAWYAQDPGFDPQIPYPRKKKELKEPIKILFKNTSVNILSKGVESTINELNLYAFLLFMLQLKHNIQSW